MLDAILKPRSIAVVGASSNPDKSSYGIMRKLQSVGYHVIPVNPRETDVLGERAYASLREIPGRVDIVDVFRRAEDTPPIADDAVAIGMFSCSGRICSAASRSVNHSQS